MTSLGVGEVNNEPSGSNASPWYLLNKDTSSRLDNLIGKSVEVYCPGAIHASALSIGCVSTQGNWCGEPRLHPEINNTMESE